MSKKRNKEQNGKKRIRSGISFSKALRKHGEKIKPSRKLYKRKAKHQKPLE